jgi:RHS repeat-associated protein
MYFKALCIIGLLLNHTKVIAQTPYVPPVQGYNGTNNAYVRTWEAKSPQTDANAIMGRTSKDVVQATQYVDGFGRPLQTVLKEGSLETTTGTKGDMVFPFVYDNLGREQYKFLPFAATTADGNFKPNPLNGTQQAFYDAQLNGQAESFYYTKTEFDNTPLSRITKTMAPGSSWVGSNRGITQAYSINDVNTPVQVWKVNDLPGSIPYTTTTYATGQLIKKETTDEYNQSVIEYVDKSGKSILKSVKDGNEWVFTYNVYDDLGTLRCVIPPKASKAAMAQNWVISQQILDELCFVYEYDDWGRLIVKKSPGAGKLYYIYDKWDRLILSQDANQRLNNQYMLSKYDQLGRTVLTAVYTYTGTIEALRNTALTYAPFLYEERSNTVHGYTSRCWPENNYEVLTVNYYDDYNWLPGQGNPFSANRSVSDDSYFLAPSASFPYPQALTQSFVTRGLPTGIKTRILGTNNYLYDISYYDSEQRIIQTISKNNTNGQTIATNQYAFNGQLLIKYERTVNGLANQTAGIKTAYEYDDLGRLLQVLKTTSASQNITTGQKITVKNEYDKLGQLKNKKLAPYYDGGNGLETLTYDYNIRGWLLGVNRSYLETPDKTHRWFGMSIGYDKTGNTNAYYASFNQAQYNGNITGVIWKSKSDGVARKYDYEYDNTNRLTKANFTQQTGTSWNAQPMNFSVHGFDADNNYGIKYDVNGNIMSMVTHSTKLNTPDFNMDALRYSYKPNSNQLNSVTDDYGTTANNMGDFTDGTNAAGTADYDYDNNGNLRLDHNKNITSIAYNHLDLPVTVTFAPSSSSGGGTIAYLYDASGVKLRKTVSQNGFAGNGNISTVTITDYVDGFIYESKTQNGAVVYSNKLLFASQEEGRTRALYTITATPHTLTGFAYDYMLRDNVGSVRMILTDEQQVNHYPVASLETAALNNEKIFYTLPDAARVNKNTVSNYPADTYTNPNDFIQKLSGSGIKQGASIVLKVMAGDKINIHATSWYRLNGTTPQQPTTSPVSELLTALISGVAGAGGKATIQEFTNSGVFTPGITDFVNSQGAANSSKPKAYVCWVLFDEQFKLKKDENNNILASGYSGFDAVGNDLELKNHVLNNIPLKASGYLYVYVINETPNINVYFDNLQVSHTRGPLLEESHYYPAGLEIAAISSKAALGLQNKYKYQGQEFETAMNYMMHEFEARHYDPQVGRWWVPDPAEQFSSPYLAMGNNWINGVDPDGRWFGWDDLAAAGIGFAAGYLSSAITTGDWGKKSLLAGGIGALTGWLAYNTGGLSLSATKAAGGTWAASNLGNFAANTTASAFSSAFPWPTIQTGNFSFSIAPAFSSSSLAANLNIGFNDGKIAAGFGFGFGYSSGVYDLSGKLLADSRGWFHSFGGVIGTSDGKYSLSLGTIKTGGATGQRIGYIGGQIGDIGFRLDEDFIPGLGDGKDRWRTGGFTATYRVNDNVTLAAGLAMVTGEKNSFHNVKQFGKNVTIGAEEKPGGYRTGALYGGVIYKGKANFIGLNNERFLHGRNNDTKGIQNFIHHKIIKKTPWVFEYRALPSKLWSYFGNYSVNSLVY